MGSIKKTETGSVLNFNTYLPKTLDETKISFTPKQSGSDTPSPENVREIVGKTSITVYQQGNDGVTHETSVSFPAVGKNLFDGEWRKGRYVDGIWANTNTWRTSELIPVEQNTTYCVSVDEPRTIGRIYCNLFDRNGNWIGSDYGTSVTTTADTVLMAICNTKNVVSAWTDIQLEKGSTATAYEPFNNTVYGGYVDISKGELVAEWTKVDMGDLNWLSGWGTYYVQPSDHKNNGSSGTPAEIICDIYPSDINYPASQVGNIDKNIRGRADYKQICIRDDDYATAADFKTAVTGHYLAYKLAEPIHYSLTPQSLTTLQGVNTMWSDGNSLTVSYTDDVVNTYDFRRHISLDTPHKASASGAVASFGTDMVGKMKCKIHFSPKQEGSGTPSPDNVRNISGRSSVKLWQSGGNLLDVNAVTFTSKKCIKTDGSIITSVYYKISNALPCSYLAGKTLTANTVIQGGGTSIKSLGFYSSDDITSDSCVLVVHKAHTSDEYVTFTVPNTAKFMVFCMNTSRTLDGRYIIEGTEPLDDSDEVGIPNEITFSFDDAPQDVDPSEVAGTIYGGYLDIAKGEIVAEWYSVPTSAWTTYKQNNGYICYRATHSPETILGGTWFSNVISEYGSFSSSAMNKNIIQKNSGSDGGTIYMALDENVDISTVQVVYPISTPIHYSLTPQSIATLRGSNRLWSDGDSVEVEYYKHTDEPQEYIPAEVLGTGNIAIVTSDGYLIGEEQDYIKY